MISQSESLLSAADYASLQTETGSMSASIIAERYGPVWTVHPNAYGASVSGTNFDSVLVGEYIVRCGCNTSSEISVAYLPSEVSTTSDASWGTVTATSIDDIKSTVDASIVAGSGFLARVFYVDVYGNLVYSECTDITATAFGSSVTVFSVGSDAIKEVAAVSTTKVYYITRNSNRNWRMYVAEESGGSWTSTDSGIFWPFEVRGFDAVSMTDHDILLMSGEMSPLLGSRVVGIEITTEINRVQGLIAFEVKNNRWSEWSSIDVNDNTPDSYTTPRENVRLSYHNSTLFATYRRAGGKGTYEYDKVAVMRSKDGRNWELPEFLPVNTTHPCVVLPRSDYLYVVDLNNVYRSPRCVWAGQTAVSYDVTPYVLNVESQAGEIRNSSLALANPPSSITDVFAGTISAQLPMLDDRMQVKYNFGYFLDGTATRIHVSTEDIVGRNEQRDVPKLNVGVGTRDYLGRMNRIRSDFAAEWPSTQCGADAYDDPTGTGYGGLRHTAPYGSFYTEDNELRLRSNNKDGIAVSTFVSDALNGSAQMGFQLSTTTQGEYAGISFRIYDRKNMFYIAWHPDEDQFILSKRLGADNDDGYTDTTLDTVDTSVSGENLGWVAGIGSTHYMKVLVRYSQVYLYVSDDGATWSSVTWAGTSAGYAELPGYNMSSSTATVWSGRFGVVGYGYSDDDQPPVYTLPWTPPGTDNIVDSPKVALLWNRQQIFRTVDFQETTPTWTLEIDGLTVSAGDPLVATANLVSSVDISEDGIAWAATDSGVWKCNMLTPGNTWTQEFTVSDMKTALSYTADPVLVGVKDIGQGYIAAIEAHSGGLLINSGVALYDGSSWSYSYVGKYSSVGNVEVCGAKCSPGAGQPPVQKWIRCKRPGNSATTSADRWFTNTSGVARKLGFSDARGSRVAGSIHIADVNRVSCGGAATTTACQNTEPVVLNGPLVEKYAGCVIDLLVSKSQGDECSACVPLPSVGYRGSRSRLGSAVCAGSGAHGAVSVDGDGPYYMVYEGSYTPSGGNLSWTTSVVEWLHGLGPNGFDGKAWCGAKISTDAGDRKRLIDNTGTVLFIPEDYFGDHNSIGYTEGFPKDGDMMFTMSSADIGTGANRAYGLWSSDGGSTWEDKTQKIRLSTGSGGLGMAWEGHTRHGCVFYKYDSEDFS